MDGPHPESGAVRVRPAHPGDAPRFLRLFDEAREEADIPPMAPDARERLREDLFGGRPRIHLIVAENADGHVVGYAVHWQGYSTDLAAPTLTLEDLYVTPTARRKGAGKALLRAVAREALARGCARLDWVADVKNDPAARLYLGAGADQREDLLVFEVEGAALEALGRKD